MIFDVSWGRDNDSNIPRKEKITGIQNSIENVDKNVREPPDI